MPDPEIMLEGEPSDYTFCPDHDDLFLAFMKLMPPGTAWDNVEYETTALDNMSWWMVPEGYTSMDGGIDFYPKPDPVVEFEQPPVQAPLPKGSVIRQFVSGLALGYLPFEDAMCESLDEWICGSADIDKGSWALDYGFPDECDIFTPNPCAKVSALGPATATYLLDLFAANGYTAEGRWLTGDDPEFPGVVSTFRVVVDPSVSPAFHETAILPFPLGSGYRLGDVQVGSLECLLDRYIPAHCDISLDIAGEFTPEALGEKLLLWWNVDTTVTMGGVLTWTDLASGQVITASGTSLPAATVINGYSWLTLDGINDYIRTASTINLIPPRAPLQALVLIDMGDALTADQAILSIADLPMLLRLSARSTGTQLQLGVSSTVTDELVDGDTSNAITGVQVLFGELTPAGEIIARMSANPAVPVTLPVTYPSTFNHIAVTVGGSHDVVPVRPFKGRVRHIMVFEDLTQHEVRQIEAWAAWDVERPDVLDGLSPYRNMRP